MITEVKVVATKMKPIALKPDRSGPRLLLINHCLLACWRSVRWSALWRGCEGCLAHPGPAFCLGTSKAVEVNSAVEVNGCWRAALLGQSVVMTAAGQHGPLLSFPLVSAFGSDSTSSPVGDSPTNTGEPGGWVPCCLLGSRRVLGAFGCLVLL